ncbi:DUF1697 domain-containing protein [Shinella zoogloeoides]|uniref:DUF1697 domain-containing protein n=1 Tax=Shinella zoogloeoides TaxID=352475 RepID=UPI00273D4E2A|nr:DUF1697 domain-containing protein [Shinella zoogloeoides]WLR94371.1 DUF1697 domain-containing protein [Shinella zoogloeoides]
MTTYVGLLHSIVLGPGKRLVMADLRAMAEELGFRNTRTLVATGNLVFDGDAAPPADIEARLEAAFRTRFGKHVDIVLRTEDAFRRLAAKNPFPDGNGPDVGIRVMRRPLGPDALARLEAIAAPDIRLALVDGDLWVDFSRKPSETKLLSHLTTKKLGIGTLRNANTVNGLCAMLG